MSPQEIEKLLEKIFRYEASEEDMQQLFDAQSSRTKDLIEEGHKILNELVRARDLKTLAALWTTMCMPISAAIVSICDEQQEFEGATYN